MKELNFQPAKSTNRFRKNYKLHDLAEYHGKNLLFQWGIDFKDYGKDRRYEKVWEKGEDKPDIIAQYKNISFLIDWKSKTKEAYWINRRAIDSYTNWSKKLNLEVIICFFIFDNKHVLVERKFALVSKHKYHVIKNKAWDKNEVVQFESQLPRFTRLNLIKAINNSTQL